MYPTIIALTSLVSIVARGEVPLVLDSSAVDGALYVKLAASLYHGHWLGAFNDATLARGPSFPTFLAVVRLAHLHLGVAQQLTYLLAAGAIAECIRVTSGRSGLALIAYVVMAMDPDNFGAAAASVNRDGLCASLCLLVIGAWFLAVHGSLLGKRRSCIVATAVVAGFSTAAFMMCREEGAWIIPALALIALGFPLVLGRSWWFRSEGSTSSRRPRLRKAMRWVVTLVIIGAATYLPITLVASVNQDHYGAALTNDISTGQFRRAYADWTRIRSGPLGYLVPLTRAQRYAAYRASPAAAQLEPNLESPHNSWMQLSCRIHPGAGCDLLGAFTVWAVRDAAAAAGHFRSEKDAQDYFGRVAAQIESACNDGRLKCASRLPALVQPLEQTSVGNIWHFMRGLLDQALTSSSFTDLPTNAPLPISPDERADALTTLISFPASQSAARDQITQFASRDWPYRALAAVYHLLLIALLPLAVVGTVAGVFLSSALQRALSLLGAALGVGLFFRLLVLAVEGTTEFPTTATRHGLIARALLLAFAVVGASQLAQLWQGRDSREFLRACPPLSRR